MIEFIQCDLAISYCVKYLLKLRPHILTNQMTSSHATDSSSSSIAARVAVSFKLSSIFLASILPFPHACNPLACAVATSDA